MSREPGSFLEPGREQVGVATASSSGLQAGSPEGLRVEDWGLIGYESALLKQTELVELVARQMPDQMPDQRTRETLVFCTHPPVVTLGRGTREGDVFGWTGAKVEVSRGGRATYHGPSQLVVYPILDLNHRGRDLHQHMRKLEKALVLTLAEFGIRASGRSTQFNAEGESEEATGVWVGSRKLASIGIGVRKWVSFHGLALNVSYDPDAFQGMKPCGFNTSTMISMEEILGTLVDRELLQSRLLKHLLALFLG